MNEKEEMSMAVFHFNPQRPYRSNPDLYLHYWGQEQCVPGHSFGPGVRDTYKIHFIHSGTGALTAGGASHCLHAGQAFLTYPHILTHYAADEREPWHYSWIAFSGDQVEHLLSRTSLTPECPVFPMDEHVMPGLFERLTAAAETAGEQVDLPLQSILYDFFSVLLHYAPPLAQPLTRSKPKNPHVDQALHYLHAHYCENVTIGLLAEKLGLDRKYLSALFKQTIGLPPQKYLLNYRMTKAAELLSWCDCSIGEIACSVGYEDPLLFSRMFKRVKGASPKEYRSLHQEKTDIML
ncbi:AraC family transcriptional regulator [Paenibacillus brevis]|nr:AraC family transcriptional regulator [Paenibacillus brevis]